MTIMEALRLANERFKQQKENGQTNKNLTDSPMLDAEILLASVLKVQKSWLFTHFSEKMRPHEEERFKEMVERRLKNEPIAYIIEKKDFFGRELFVNQCVLIPRPATEALISEAINIVKDKPKEAVLFADIGTGSGAIAVSLAAESKIPVIASDISKKALAVAKINASKFNLEDMIDFQCGNLLEPLIALFKKINKIKISPITILCICANLPYLTNKQLETAQIEMQEFEPKIALEAGRDGLEAYWNFFKQLKSNRLIFPKDTFVIAEFDPSQSEKIEKLILHDFPIANVEIKKDLDGNDRIVVIQL